MSALESVPLPSDGARFSLVGFVGDCRVTARCDGRVVRVARVLFDRAVGHVGPTSSILAEPDSGGAAATEDRAICWLVACIRAIDRIVACEMQDASGRVHLRYDDDPPRSSAHLPFPSEAPTGFTSLS